MSLKTHLDGENNSLEARASISQKQVGSTVISDNPMENLEDQISVQPDFDSISENIPSDLPEGTISSQETMQNVSFLYNLLEDITPIDFYEESGVVPGNKLTNKHYVVYSVEYLHRLAKSKNWGLAKIEGQIYIFNGSYWVQISKEEMKDFLGKAAEKLGIEVCTSKYHGFKEDLYKQFISSAYRTKNKQHKQTLINFQNGTLELNFDGKTSFRGFDRSDLLTYQLPFNYDPNADCPIFMNYLSQVLPDVDQQSIIAEYISYAFFSTSLLKLEKALILYGSGANGKSVLLDVVKNLLGDENVSNYTLQSLTNETGYQRAMLANKLLNLATEISSKMDTTMFKALVSGENVEARLPYLEPIIIQDYAKLLFSTNELPKDVEQNTAFFRRFILIEFGVTIPESDRDPDLAKKIISSELPGILNWVLRGMDRLHEYKRFTYSVKSEKSIEEYQIQSDSVKLFLSEEQYEPCVQGVIELKFLYLFYRNYCQESGYRPCSSRVFSDRLRRDGYVFDRKNTGYTVNICKK